MRIMLYLLLQFIGRNLHLLPLITFVPSVQVLKTMRESGVQPDVVAYTAAIKVQTFLHSVNSYL